MKKLFLVGLLIAFSFNNNTYAENSRLIRAQKDASGKITVAVFERSAGNEQAHFTDFAIDVPEGFVAIGGGIRATNLGSGNLITASYPNDQLTAWIVSSKDHLYPNPVRIVGYAIGLKIEGLTQQQLMKYISVGVQSSSWVSHPDTSSGVPEGYQLIGGGVRVDWSGAGNLVTASYPENNFSWRVKTKDHVTSSPATAFAYAIGIKKALPGIGRVSVDITSTSSGSAGHPASAVTVTPGYALTSCGANVHWQGAGNLLWKIKPLTEGSFHGCEVASKDHKIVSPATITSYAVGIRLH